MQTALTGVIPLRGDLRIAIRDAVTNEVRWRYEIRNTITYVALKALVNLISQKSTVDPVDYKVGYLRMGGYLTAGPVVAPIAPVRADVNLQAPLPNPATPHTITLGDAEKYLTVSNPFEMKIVATLAAGDLNGYTLFEAGLLTRGTIIAGGPGTPGLHSGFYPELFARQIHPTINKTAAFVVDYDWRISFTS